MNTTPTSVKDVWMKNQHVLLQITSGFGFNETISKQLLQEVKASMTGYSSTENLSLRLWLAKKLVRHCVFLVSRDMFMAKPVAGSQTYVFMIHPILKAFTIHKTREMSLPVWTTYLLVDIIGFNDLEAANILNVHPFKLREQLSFARSLVA
jgi:hypothetical protein